MNQLSQETSPYLLQHADNPVHWTPWTSSALEKATEENKLLIISIGYSACHWCHVMEHESFEDPDVAAIMNAHFISIKVDREERPDVDQIYMNAVQLMTGQGGWPLNVVALPDGRPVWGGTYFRKDDWKDALQQLQKLYLQQPSKLEEYANKLEMGIRQFDLIEKNNEQKDFSTFDLPHIIKNSKTTFDTRWGGFKGSPKFMMPNSIEFWLAKGVASQDKTLLDHVALSLTRMARGGLYDIVGGGFARYSVDEKWHVPHFEKMLYDNAQLVSLYSKAYSQFGTELFKRVVEETIMFLERELSDSSGAFYSSLDADSINSSGDLKEGAYYSFTEKELKQIIASDFSIFKEVYNVNSFGKWEEDQFVLIQTEDDTTLAERFSISKATLLTKKKEWKQKLFNYRNQRSRPGLDDKSLTSWNGLVLIGLIDAYKSLQKKTYLDNAIKNANFLMEQQRNKENGGLYHSYKNGKSSISGYLEDYSLVIAGFLNLHEATFDEKWLLYAKELTEYTLDHFFDSNTSMFYFTDVNEHTPIARTIEYRDNVIPASNSVMAHNLFVLSHHFSEERYLSISKQMLLNVLPEISKYPRGFSNWMLLLLKFKHPFHEIVIMGSKAQAFRMELQQEYTINNIITGCTTESSLPLLKNRFVPNKTYAYVCKDNACNLPQTELGNVIKMLKKENN